jgi:hypothetical protein
VTLDRVISNTVQRHESVDLTYVGLVVIPREV